MTKRLILLVFLTLNIKILFSQTGSISGFVFDQSNGESLSGANIYFENIPVGSVTNRSGYFVISDIPPGAYTLICSYIGYKDFKDDITLNDDESIKLAIQLEPALLETETVVVTADSERTALRLFRKDISKINISPMEIKNLPAVVESDLLRALQSLPGILPISDYSSEIYVRGGTSDQNLYLIDGADVYNPEHAFGLFSTFNTDAIKDIEVSKGGFSAEYGGRLSSVL
ncbi:MAG: TonB-dependent receptor, partial [Calditrichia bacterium]|nr:TonB-dependent receptor [Calditrichia bacterium]